MIPDDVVIRWPVRRLIRLELDDVEAEDVHSALAVVVSLLEAVEPGPGATLTRESLPRLQQVARRLDHERRHRGRNPHGPSR